MIEVQALTRSFGKRKAVDGVSLTFGGAAITGLIGPNGAGKTTLFNLLAGAVHPDSGSIRLQGQRIDGLAPHRIFGRGLARTFQIPRPFGTLTVLENLLLVPGDHPGEHFYGAWLSPKRVLARERVNRTKARDILEFVTLAPLAHEKAANLSGGQQKLLELARVMMADPRMVLLDEPGAGVNPALLDVLIDRILALHRQGLGFVVIEHNIDLVTRICEPVVVMAQGRVLAQGTAETVRRDPRVIDAYLGDVQ